MFQAVERNLQGRFAPVPSGPIRKYMARSPTPTDSGAAPGRCHVSPSAPRRAIGSTMGYGCRLATMPGSAPLAYLGRVAVQCVTDSTAGSSDNLRYRPLRHAVGRHVNDAPIPRCVRFAGAHAAHQPPAPLRRRSEVAPACMVVAFAQGVGRFRFLDLPSAPIGAGRLAHWYRPAVGRLRGGVRRGDAIPPRQCVVRRQQLGAGVPVAPRAGPPHQLVNGRPLSRGTAHVLPSPGCTRPRGGSTVAARRQTPPVPPLPGRGFFSVLSPTGGRPRAALPRRQRQLRRRCLR